MKGSVHFGPFAREIYIDSLYLERLCVLDRLLWRRLAVIVPSLIVRNMALSKRAVDSDALGSGWKRMFSCFNIQHVIIKILVYSKKPSVDFYLFLSNFHVLDFDRFSFFLGFLELWSSPEEWGERGDPGDEGSPPPLLKLLAPLVPPLSGLVGLVVGLVGLVGLVGCQHRPVCHH